MTGFKEVKLTDKQIIDVLDKDVSDLTNSLDSMRRENIKLIYNIEHLEDLVKKITEKSESEYCELCLGKSVNGCNYCDHTGINKNFRIKVLFAKVQELTEENERLKNPLKKKQGHRGKQKGYNYKVMDTDTGELKMFRTMKEISQEYGVSITGINNHVRGWKIKKFDHLDIQYINKKN